VNLVGGVITGMLGGLAPGATATITITVIPSAAGSFSNHVNVRADQADPGHEDNESVLATPVRPSGPTVVGVHWLKSRRQPLRLVLTFSEALDPSRAKARAGYRIVAPGRDSKFGTHDDRSLRLASVTYSPAPLTVTLRPATGLNLHSRYLLVVYGTGSAGLRDLAGNFLDGDRDALPGGNAQLVIDRSVTVITESPHTPAKVSDYAKPYRVTAGTAHPTGLRSTARRSGRPSLGVQLTPSVSLGRTGRTGIES
jgi:hypothetical protein